MDPKDGHKITLLCINTDSDFKCRSFVKLINEPFGL